MDNKLSLHLGKTEAMIFGTKRKLKKVELFEVRCGNIEINNVKEVKYLAYKKMITIQESLTSKIYGKKIILV